MEGHSVVRTVEEVFEDFKGRRSAIIKALTTDVVEFYQSCDPTKKNLCLYGQPDGEWEVDLPAEEVPPLIPEPVIGINFARDGMHEKDWVSLVAAHSDAWLHSVAIFYGASLGFDKVDRIRLFFMMNDLPPVVEVVADAATKKQSKEKSSVSNSSSNGSKSDSKRGRSEPEPKVESKVEEGEEEDDEEDEEEEDEERNEEEKGETKCGECSEVYTNEEFWICCDRCESWYHGRCVKITPGRAKRMKRFNCPSCNNRARY